MPLKKTYYEILGVPRTATADQIKKRYRELVREHHPDVASNKALAQQEFVEISEAYRTLSNPDKRVIYDASMDAEMFRQSIIGRPRASGTTARRSAGTQESASTRRTTGASRKPPHQSQSTAQSRADDVRKCIREAQTAFIRGQFRSAIIACREAQRLDPRNAQVHAILGDIYRIQDRIDEAIAMYTVAAQLDPRNHDVQVKLDRLSRQSARGTDETSSAERQTSLRMGLSFIAAPIAAVLLAWLYLSPGEPIGWLHKSVPVLDSWSSTLVGMLLAIGALAGFLLSVNGAIQPIDDELVFSGVRAAHGPRPAHYPLGMILLGFNFLSFYLAAVTYILVGIVQESLSKSIMYALGTTFGLVLAASLAYSPGPTQVLLFGGNVVLPALLVGWGIGDLFRPTW
jgi:tetratricopeptide (TPR) repeat protein